MSINVVKVDREAGVRTVKVGHGVLVLRNIVKVGQEVEVLTVKVDHQVRRLSTVKVGQEVEAEMRKSIRNQRRRQPGVDQ